MVSSLNLFFFYILSFSSKLFNVVIWDHYNNQYLKLQVIYSGVDILPTDELYLFHTFILFLLGGCCFSQTSTRGLSIPLQLFPFLHPNFASVLATMTTGILSDKKLKSFGKQRG